MNSVELNDLGLHIDHLIDLISKLKNENQVLRNRLASTIRECTVLRDQNQKACMQIKKIVEQLKETAS